MLDIDIKSSVLSFIPIQKNKFVELFQWYNDIDEYKFATGIDSPITFDKLYEKYEEVYFSEHEFLLGIYLKPHNKCIGVIRGGLNNKINDALWINSIIIDKKFQRNGYGTIAVEAISSYFKNTYGIMQTFVSVVNKNEKAIKFWEKLGYETYRRMNNHLVLDNEKQDVIIMMRQLNKCETFC